MGRSLGQNSKKLLFPTPGFQEVAVVALEMEQEAVREAGTDSIFMQSPASSPVHELLTPFYLLHSYPKTVSSS